MSHPNEREQHEESCAQKGIALLLFGVNKSCIKILVRENSKFHSSNWILAAGALVLSSRFFKNQLKVTWFFSVTCSSIQEDFMTSQFMTYYFKMHVKNLKKLPKVLWTPSASSLTDSFKRSKFWTSKAQICFARSASIKLLAPSSLSWRISTSVSSYEKSKRLCWFKLWNPQTWWTEVGLHFATKSYYISLISESAHVLTVSLCWEKFLWID